MKKSGIIIFCFFICFQSLIFSNDLKGLMNDYFSEDNHKKLTKIIKKIISTKNNVWKLEEILFRGPAFSPLKKTDCWIKKKNKCMDKKKRHYFTYIPTHYNYNKKTPVLFFLRGGISRTIPLTSLKNTGKIWEFQAKRNNFILVVPDGESGAEWWSDVGVKNIFSILKTLKKSYNIDENRIFLTGFSDGASGALWMALSRPTKWAGFLPYSGYLSVVRNAAYQAYPGNLSSRPIRATNGGRDELYPSSQILEMYVNKLKKAGVKLTWKDYPSAGHNLSYLKDELPHGVDFIKTNVRNPFPKMVKWSTSDKELGRIDWLVIEELKKNASNDVFKVLNIMSKPGRIQLGLSANNNSSIGGVKIGSVARGSLAEWLGVLPGDIITHVDGVKIGNFLEFKKYIQGKKFDKLIKIMINRDGQVKELQGTPRFRSTPIFSRKKATSTILVLVKKNQVKVKTENISRFSILVSSRMFDVSKSLVIKINDKEVFNSKVTPDPEFMLRQYLKDRDRETVYYAKLTFDL